jgi:Mn2+/Fe2+ NRAMP family transporter
MKKIFEIALGIVTSVGGFLEIGSIATAAQGGAAFGYKLAWAIALGGICIIFLVEMSGRFAAVSGHTITGAVRERFGFNFFVIPLIGFVLLSLLVLSAELGGVCVALELFTGISFQWWALPVGILIWLLIWIMNFGVIEKGVSLLGLITLCFVFGALHTHPEWNSFNRSLIPSLPKNDSLRYWFMVVSILGASISPYLFLFYSSGAVEDKWDKSYITVNKIIAAFGMGFGTLISLAVLILAVKIFQPRGIQIDHYSQLGTIISPIYGHKGFLLFIGSLFIACLGACLEIALEIAYFISQGFGWNWGENKKPRDAALFSLAYMGTIILATLLILIGIDPLKLTILSMALTAATLPLFTIPFLILMNDKKYMKDQTNGPISNAVVILIIALGFVLSIVTIPLEIFGS